MWGYQHSGVQRTGRVIAAYTSLLGWVLCVAFTGAGLAHQSYYNERDEAAGWAITWRIATTALCVASGVMFPLGTALILPFSFPGSKKAWLGMPRAWVPLCVGSVVAVGGGVVCLVDPLEGVAGAVFLGGSLYLAGAGMWASLSPTCCVSWAPEWYSLLRSGITAAGAVLCAIGMVIRAALQEDCDGSHPATKDCPLSEDFSHNALAYLFVFLGILVWLALIPVFYLQRVPIVWVTGDHPAVRPDSDAHTVDDDGDEYYDEEYDGEEYDDEEYDDEEYDDDDE